MNEIWENFKHAIASTLYFAFAVCGLVFVLNGLAECSILYGFLGVVLFLLGLLVLSYSIARG